MIEIRNELKSNRPGFKKLNPEINKRVLIVEDDPYWQKKIQLDLSQAFSAIDCVVVDNIEAAVKKIKSNYHFDVVIADHQLNGPATGYDLWKSSLIQLNRTTFILTSGNDLLKICNFADLQNGLSVLQKPFNTDRLMHVVESKPREPESSPAQNYEIKSILFISAIVITIILFANEILKHVPVTVAKPFVQSIELPTIEKDLKISSSKTNKVRTAISLPSSQKFSVDQIVTPELKRKIQRIVQRANDFEMEMKKTTRKE